MRRGKILRLIGVLVLTGLALWVVVTSFHIGSFRRENWRLGLDLQGGTHLVYEANLEGVEDPEVAMELARDIIERRVNAYGVSEPVIQIQGSNRISVQLPGVKDIGEAIELIGRTAKLDFRELAYEYDEETGELVEKWIPATGLLVVDGDPIQLTGEHFKSNSRAGYSQQTMAPEPVVFFWLKEGDGPALFEQITRRLLYKPLGIFLDNELISAPTVQVPLSDSGVITGLSIERARVLAIQLNQGALPLPLSVVRQQDVDATLGADSLKKSLLAGGIGLGLVLLFMMLYYRLPGFLASCALIIYALLVLAIFKLIPVTLTLAGIAAFILSIGIAVDANILIFERMKEELRDGRTLGAAIEAGFNRAWTSIRDSNISTILTCVILYWFGHTLGATMVMGFALTLLIGVLVSMFTAIVITRTLLRFLIGTRLARKLSLFMVGQQGDS